MDETVDTFSKAICSKWLQAVDGIFALGEKELKSGNKRLLLLTEQMSLQNFPTVTSKGKLL